MGDIRQTGYNLPISDLTHCNTTSNMATQYFDFARNVDRSRKRRREHIDSPKDNNLYFNSKIPVIDLTRKNDQFANRRIPVIDLTDDEVIDITDQIQCIDLTNDDSSSNRHPIQRFELTRNDDYSNNSHPNRRFEFTRNDDPSRTATNSHPNLQFELTRNDDSLSSSNPNRHFEFIRNDDSSTNSQPNRYFEFTKNDESSSSNYPIRHFELASNDGSSRSIHSDRHFELSRNDDSSSSIHPNQHFELTRIDDYSSISHPKQHYELTRNDDKDINHSTKHFDMTDSDSQNFNPNTPVIDSTDYNHDFANYRIPDRTHNNVQNITHELQYTGLPDSKNQRSVSDCIPTAALTYDISQSVDQTIPSIHLNAGGNYENYMRPMFDPACPNAGNFIHNAKGINLTGQFKLSTDTIQNNGVVPIDIAGMYDAKVRICNNLPTNLLKRVPENNPKIPFETPKYDAAEYNLFKCNETPNMNCMQVSTSTNMQKHPSGKEIILKNPHPLTNNFQEKVLSPGKHVKISQNNTSDFLKSSRHPIPFRHSLGRSTVNTSKNVPIETTETSKGGSSTTTVSATLRRKKAKSSSGISKQNLSNSLEPASRAGTLPFGAVKEIFLKFLIFSMFIWIFFMFLWYFSEF